IVGFLVAKGNLDAGAIGRIALRDHSALVAVPLKEAARLVDILNSHKIKNTRARITRLGK
ncbi:MAG: DbpA RNA binding domain-containing protein, partial [Duncaniella sp.]|nr:DbpA RNA binding domain-containing protein [Duncaniella sp.]